MNRELNQLDIGRPRPHLRGLSLTSSNMAHANASHRWQDIYAEVVFGADDAVIPPSGFQAAWARYSNIIIQPGFAV